MEQRLSRRQTLGLGALLAGCTRARPAELGALEPSATGATPGAVTLPQKELTAPLPGQARAVEQQGRRLRIAFGSCNKVNSEQNLWRVIAAQAPDVWVWLGDSVYADTEDMQVMRAMYDEQNRSAEYAALARNVVLTGTWDDHDYGVNDGGKGYARRVESQQAYLDFLRVPTNSPRRTREGVYTSHTFGEGVSALKLILLDARYHRDLPGPDADVLGAGQWAWLEAELKSSLACVHLIGSGIQVIAEEHRFEKWANFPKARARLLELVRASRAAGVIFLSGDRHVAELSVLARGAYPLHDLTSSGLTHSWTSFPGEPNRHRHGDVFAGRNFGLVDLELNGQLDAAERPLGSLRLAVLDFGGAPRLERQLRLQDLRG